MGEAERKGCLEAEGRADSEQAGDDDPATVCFGNQSLCDRQPEPDASRPTEGIGTGFLSKRKSE